MLFCSDNILEIFIFYIKCYIYKKQCLHGSAQILMLCKKGILVVLSNESSFQYK